MTELALHFIELALKGLRDGGEFEKYKSNEDRKESWIDDLETLKEMLQSSSKGERAFTFRGGK